eukprot:3366361-Pleurochrysis_carterae.AAC.1
MCMHLTHAWITPNSFKARLLSASRADARAHLHTSLVQQTHVHIRAIQRARTTASQKEVNRACTCPLRGEAAYTAVCSHFVAHTHDLPLSIRQLHIRTCVLPHPRSN